MKSVSIWFGSAVLVSVTTMACGAPAPRVPFATATEAQVRDSEAKETWFEFHTGDEVPLAMLYTGVLESKTPVVARAARPFWLIVAPNQPARFSFDGKSAVSSFGKAGVGITHDAGRNYVGLLVYIGKPEDAPHEMR
jgi:hypothetical protein